ncbi:MULTISPECIES: cytochrome C [Sulfurimonas]|uniref:cytochrome C n=1 Tax=Sulfurimonas TaxID=202746 RepID=UPI00125F410C|nr:cytochrome C [Sulfurimonas hydrogeniphila]
MKKMTSLLLAAAVAGSVFTTSATADASKGQRFYLKKLKICKKDGLKNGAVFAIKHDRKGWASLKESGKLQEEWMKICPHGVKKIKKMKEKDVKNLYDFVWKYAADGEVPTCG